MGYRWYRARRWIEDHALEINMGFLAFSVGMIAKSEIQWKMMHKDIYVHLTTDELASLLRGDVSMATSHAPNNYHIHLLKTD